MTEIGEPATASTARRRSSTFQIIDDETSRPAADAEVVLLGPDGREIRQRADGNGNIRLPSDVDGEWLLLRVLDYFYARDGR